MKRMIQRYIKNPTYENAVRLIKYSDAHPRAACFMTVFETLMFRIAERVVSMEDRYL